MPTKQNKPPTPRRYFEMRALCPAIGAALAITDAFKTYCGIKARLDDYPVLNESDYSEKEYEATLENYRSEMWDMEKALPEGWASEVYSWFSDNGHDRHTEDRDDQGGYAPKEDILEALSDLGMLPTLILAAKPA